MIADIDDDLFAVRPKSTRKRVDRPVPSFERVGPVASFACYCGAIDEVREPAPSLVDCWQCRQPLGMHRFVQRVAPPLFNARRLTDAETARI